MAKRRIKKKELKAPDEFTVELRRLVDAVSKRKAEIVVAAIIVVLVFVGSAVFKSLRNSKLKKVNQMFFSAIKDNDSKKMEQCLKNFQDTYLGRMAGLITARKKYESGDTKGAIETLKKVKPPHFSKLSFVVKSTKNYLKGSIDSEINPQKGLESFELVSKGKYPYLKALSEFRRAVLLDRMGGMDCLDLYSSLSKDPELSGSFIGNFSEERVLSLKNKK